MKIKRTPIFLVCPPVCYTCTRSRTVRDRILKFGMQDEYENQEDPYFCFGPSHLSLQSYCPFQFHCKPMEACELNISRTT